MQVDVQLALEDAAIPTVPNTEQIRLWVNTVIRRAEVKKSAEQMTVRIVELDEITQLNEQYRQKNGPTNVLSFPFESPPGVPAEVADSVLGDVVICAAVVAREAAEQNKTLIAHWAHMVVHGTLHLLGYDHMQESEAEQMESLEIAVLTELGYADPYS